MLALDNLTVIVFSYRIKDFGSINIFTSGEKITVYTTLSAKTTEKRVKNKKEKNREPITKFYSV